MSNRCSKKRKTSNPLPTDDVGFALAQSLVAGDAKNRNIVFSPLSLYASLSLVASGASGPSKDQILSFLKADSSSYLVSLYSDVVAVAMADGADSGGPKLSFANGLWVRKSETIKNDFTRVAEDVYDASISLVDFNNKQEACKEVNSWIKEKTEGLIKHVLDPSSMDDSTRLIIANALYFKGQWVHKFTQCRPKDTNFHLLDGSSVNVPFMTNRKRQAVRAYDDGFKVLRLPYEHGSDSRRFSMYLLLPDSKDGLPDLMNRACSQSGFLESHIPHVEVELGLLLVPKFKIRFKFEVREVLRGLGLVLPFDCELGGLTEIVEDTELFVSEIVHEAFIDVDEKGTKAAAVTQFAGRPTGGPCPRREPLMSFVADHPFMYVIREDTTGAVLFIGQVLNPAKN